MGVPIVNPVAKYLFAHPELYPLPNAAPSDGIANNNLQGPTRNFKANNQGDVKIEYDPNQLDKITGFYAMSTGYDGKIALLGITFPAANIYPTKVMGVNWVHIFSPSIVNSARVGFTRTVWAQGQPQDPTGLFGAAGNSKVGINFPNQAFNGFSFQNIEGGTSSQGSSNPNPVNSLSGVGTPAFDGGVIDNTYSYIDTLTWQHGKHTVDAGIQATRYQNNYPTSNNNGYLGSLTYSGAFTSNPAISNAGGYGGADFVLDRVSAAAGNPIQRQCRTAAMAHRRLHQRCFQSYAETHPHCGRALRVGPAMARVQ